MCVCACVCACDKLTINLSLRVQTKTQENKHSQFHSLLSRVSRVFLPKHFLSSVSARCTFHVSCREILPEERLSSLSIGAGLRYVM